MWLIMRKNTIYFWGNYISKLTPTKLFYPQETGEITKNLFTVRDQDTNIYIYTNGTHTICFDAGYKNNNYLYAEFKKIGIQPNTIRHLFLTHTDEDHAGAIDSDSNSNWLTNTKIYLGRKEDQLIKRKIFRKFIFYTPVTISREYYLIDDGFCTNIGNIHVKAISTPGHTSGHISYLIDHEILITGDLILLKDNKILPFYRFWNKDHKVLKQSIKKVFSLNDRIEIICTAHFGHTLTGSNLSIE